MIATIRRILPIGQVVTVCLSGCLAGRRCHRAAGAVLLALAVLMPGWPGPAMAEGEPGPMVQQQPGYRHRVTVGDLPAPYASDSVANSALKVARPLRAHLNLPPGFTATSFASGIGNPRYMVVSPAGDVYVADSQAGRVLVLRDSDGDGRADRQAVVLTGLSRPYGLYLQDGFLYVADTKRVWRVPFEDGFPRAHANPEPVTARGDLGDGAGHWTRNVVVAPDGSRLLVAIGSRSNIGIEPPPRASIQSFSPDGREQQDFATGLRNPVGMAFYPGTDRLFAVVNERDGLGDGLVPDYLTEIEPGAFYGWPYAYIGQHPQPELAGQRPDLVQKTRVPDLLFQPHSAPLGLAFYDGERFPARYRGGAFVALHGSWNRSDPTGYMVAFVPFEAGKPAGWYETFASGWWLAGPRVERNRPARVWGRPCGVAVTPAGDLLVSDDVGGEIWLIRYGGG